MHYGKKYTKREIKIGKSLLGMALLYKGWSGKGCEKHDTLVDVGQIDG